MAISFSGRFSCGVLVAWDSFSMSSLAVSQCRLLTQMRTGEGNCGTLGPQVLGSTRQTFPEATDTTGKRNLIHDPLKWSLSSERSVLLATVEVRNERQNGSRTPTGQLSCLTRSDASLPITAIFLLTFYGLGSARSDKLPSQANLLSCKDVV